ncbi:MAG: ATP-binding cassette domain-containing protein [Phascolarctobacterium faecium]
MNITLPAVCNVSFSVAPGECLGWLGKRLRKSTLARLLMGLTPADSGTVSFNGQPLTLLMPHCEKIITVRSSWFSKCRCFSPPEKHRQLDHAANAELRLY